MRLNRRLRRRLHLCAAALLLRAGPHAAPDALAELLLAVARASAPVLRRGEALLPLLQEDAVARGLLLALLLLLPSAAAPSSTPAETCPFLLSL